VTDQDQADMMVNTLMSSPGMSPNTDDMPVMLKVRTHVRSEATPVNKSYKSVKLADLLKDIVPAEFQIDAMDIDLGSMFISKS